MTITVFDYGAGNLHSLVKVLESTGRSVHLETDLRRALATKLLVLPGVGAFSAAASRMADARAEARDALRAGLPCLGICLGMQLLFDASDEGPGAGLGFLAGRVTRLDATRVPQIGWNTLDDVSDPLFARAALRTAYYANAFVCRPTDPAPVVAWSTHESDRFPAAVRIGNTLGVQFHPEKSSAPGVEFIRRFIDDILPD
ncbi:MAG: imidazole glycerol phosphate synthase subunit HisH [Gemmatimonadaceae bacterium]|nr:imidazole glycerol phosphate synthase subunit HisH [Gemmatimonadaceae bacterium]